MDYPQIDTLVSIRDFSPFSAVLQVYADLLILCVPGRAEVRGVPGRLYGVAPPS